MTRRTTKAWAASALATLAGCSGGTADDATYDGSRFTTMVVGRYETPRRRTGMIMAGEVMVPTTSTTPAQVTLVGRGGMQITTRLPADCPLGGVAAREGRAIRVRADRWRRAGGLEERVSADEAIAAVCRTDGARDVAAGAIGTSRPD